ncbi:MAG TPA: hypothetical protein DIU00_21535 [Phycisphaerales bacterium]|nr:hypothetical protein [Phycisphaerales bacterium]
MNSQDLINISHKAKSETEAFINRHLNDRAKGWPKSSLCRPAYTQYRQDQQAASGSNIRILLAQ